MKTLEVIDTGKVSYLDSYDLQLRCLEDLKEDEEKPGYLIITEPTPTITKGIRGEDSEIFLSEDERKKKGIELIEIRRGGRVTFHGPGQVVIYPILNLVHFKKSVKWYIESLEKVVTLTLENLGIKVHKKDGLVGIFTERGKICAIGVEVKRWKTLHGIAINHDILLDYFGSINPCGLGDLGVTSVSNEGKKVRREEIIELFKSNFSKVFEVGFLYE
jgi:lipoyl(octanoyl) transferase